ncbi:hypothetical protein COO60DRAFT_173553 [Scenedesmus sp. NREL 46B-D3]|nr:hypothetical protein COO60DRAFT_173553 [Scenedesmus sp. NREL 46B-D3]
MCNSLHKRRYALAAATAHQQCLLQERSVKKPHCLLLCPCHLHKVANVLTVLDCAAPLRHAVLIWCCHCAGTCCLCCSASCTPVTVTGAAHSHNHHQLRARTAATSKPHHEMCNAFNDRKANCFSAAWRSQLNTWHSCFRCSPRPHTVSSIHKTQPSTAAHAQQCH